MLNRCVAANWHFCWFKMISVPEGQIKEILRPETSDKPQFIARASQKSQLQTFLDWRFDLILFLIFTKLFILFENWEKIGVRCTLTEYSWCQKINYGRNMLMFHSITLENVVWETETAYNSVWNSCSKTMACFVSWRMWRANTML